MEQQVSGDKERYEQHHAYDEYQLRVYHNHHRHNEQVWKCVTVAQGTGRCYGLRRYRLVVGVDDLGEKKPGRE